MPDNFRPVNQGTRGLPGEAFKNCKINFPQATATVRRVMAAPRVIKQPTPEKFGRRLRGRGQGPQAGRSILK